MKGNQTNEVITDKNIKSNNEEFNSNKQIEKMAIYLYHNTTAYNTCWEEDCEDIAKILYKAGYRKERQGEWKKVNEKYPRYVCTACNHLYNNKEYKYCPNCSARMKGGTEQ